ncbi:putative membrane protein [Rhodopirellula maiorica SM1]|uniref:Putative membrane protein n=2 Tax=Novipirellula TaxID=2795426 RepID=M5RRA5_9BACT|nr:putative membrane protein [Rhodopirellula maiorica SM1]
MLYHFVPGYDSLRYPAKWLPIAAFAASMVTAYWLENLPRFAASTRHALITIAIVMVVAFVVVLGIQYDPARWIGNRAAVPPDPFWGPLDIAGGLREVFWSIVHSTIVLACVAWVLLRLQRHRLSRMTAMRCLLGIVAIDMAVFAAGNIARVTTNRDATKSIPIADAELMTLRTRTGNGWPRVWQEAQDKDRLTEVELSSEIAWFGRWHLADRGHVLNNMTSIRSQAMAMFWKATREVSGTMPPKQRAEFWIAVSQWLGIEQTLNATESSRLASHLNLVDTQISQTPSHPAIQIHYAWSIQDSATANSRDFKSLLGEVLDATHVPCVYVNNHGGELLSPNPIDEPDDQWILKNETADSVEIEIEASAACLLQRNVYQDGHWHASLVSLDSAKTRPATVHRVDYLKQGVLVPPGRWVVTFEYKPWWMMPSIVVATFAWLTILIGWGKRHGWLLRRRGLSSR